MQMMCAPPWFPHPRNCDFPETRFGTLSHAPFGSSTNRETPINSTDLKAESRIEDAAIDCAIGVFSLID